MLGECIVLAHDRSERVFNQRLDSQRRFINRPTQESDIEAVFDQLGYLLGGIQFGELEIDVRVVPAMSAHDVRQDAVHGGLQGTNMKMTQMTGGRPACGGEGPFAVRQRQSGLTQKCGAGIGEFDRAPGPIDEVHSQLAFELLNLLTQRWLGDVKALGGAAEVSFLGHGHEVAKQAHLRIGHIHRI